MKQSKNNRSKRNAVLNKVIYKQIALFASRNGFTLVETETGNWDIFNKGQILISLELFYHNSKIIVELTGYLSTEINIVTTPDILRIINSDIIKEQTNSSNINVLGTLLLNSKTLIIDKQFKNDIKYLILFELCAFDYENKTISKLISQEYSKTFAVNLN